RGELDRHRDQGARAPGGGSGESPDHSGIMGSPAGRNLLQGQGMDSVRSWTLHADRSRQDHRGLSEEHPQPWVGVVMRRTGLVGVLGVPLILLLGSLSSTLVWAASLARDPVQVVKSGTNVTLYGVAFASPTAGWVVGSAGTILATTNGGASWKPQKSGSQETLYDVAFPAPRVGWAVGGLRTIVSTKDGGRTWKVRESGTPSTLFDSAFPDPTIGWIAGNGGALLQSVDGGEKWEDRSLSQPVDLTGLAFTDIKTGWVVGDRGAIFRTTDGGFTWAPYGRGPQATFYATASRNGKVGIAV